LTMLKFANEHRDHSECLNQVETLKQLVSQQSGQIKEQGERIDRLSSRIKELEALTA
jgi:peptidoglycan hydrolase CwlO-like protein